jgi:hypothetical protein
MAGIDWASAGDRLYADTRAAFSRFPRKHPGEVCSHVSYHSDPHNGIVLLGFDTPANSLRVVRRIQQDRLQHARDMLGRAPWQQRDAHHFLKSWSLMPFNVSGDRLAFQQEVIWEFPEWVEFASADGYEALCRSDDYDGDYLVAGIALCLWRLVERLDAERAFDDLPLATPCLVSYDDHGTRALVGLRVLNLPPA